MYHEGLKRFDVFTARKRSLGQGNVCSTVFDSVHRGGLSTILLFCFYFHSVDCWTNAVSFICRNHSNRATGSRSCRAPTARASVNYHKWCGLCLDTTETFQIKYLNKNLKCPRNKWSITTSNERLGRSRTIDNFTWIFNRRKFHWDPKELNQICI